MIEKIKILLRKLACWKFGHQPILVIDKKGMYKEIFKDIDNEIIFPDLPSRYCLFECKRCKKKFAFYRFGFVKGCGSLEYFFNRENWKIGEDIYTNRKGIK